MSNRPWKTGGDMRAAAAANGKKVGRPAGDEPREPFSVRLPGTLIDWIDDESRRSGKSRAVLAQEALELLRRTIS
jgi:hypothetical protein